MKMTKANFSYQNLILNNKNVSRETFLKLECFVDLLLKWQKSINLIGNNTISEIWDRHIIDSAQLFDLIELNQCIADIGTGAGLPGLVLAIMGIRNITLIEKDSRKAAFLREAVKKIDIKYVTIINQNVKDCSLPKIDVFVARALAPLNKLLNILESQLNSTHKLLLMKGKNYQSEIDAARLAWDFDCEKYASKTDLNSAILVLSNCYKKGISYE